MDNQNSTNEKLKKPVQEHGENTSDVTAGQNERTVENLANYHLIDNANRNQLLENKDNKFRFYEKDSGASITRESQIENGKRVYLFNLMDKDGRFIKDTETRTLNVTEKYLADEIDQENSKFLALGNVSPENIMNLKDAKIALLCGAITRREFLSIERRLEQGVPRQEVTEKEGEEKEVIEEEVEENNEDEKFLELQKVQEKIRAELVNLSSFLESMSKNSSNLEIQTSEKNNILGSVDKIILYLKDTPINTNEIETLVLKDENKRTLLDNQKNNNELLTKFSGESEKTETLKNDVVFNKNIKLIKESME